MENQGLERIRSFSLDHDNMQKGLYCNMHAEGITTWDLRFKTPNGGDYISPKALHSIEHILATLLRNSAKKEDIVYFGPMGCRTGFYLLTVRLDYAEVLALVKDALRRVPSLTAVPGSARIECGNYREHDLEGAKRECLAYLAVLEQSEKEV